MTTTGWLSPTLEQLWNISQQWRVYILSGVIVSYLYLVRLLRYRRRDNLPKKLRLEDRASFSRMTIEEAHSILLLLVDQEFPTILHTSLFFALFKTYGIPSISELLVATGQFAGPCAASKRAADTGVLLREIVLNKVGSDRSTDGIARMNYLHSRYRKSSKISDNDMLYTLSLFALEPVRWVGRYEWRELTDLERCALGVFWKDLGEAMEIPYDALRPGEDGFRDGLHWMEQINQWSLRYEKKYMDPAPTNAKLLASTMDVALFYVPVMFRGVAEKLISTLLEPRLRIAMMIDDPPASYERFLKLVTSIRKLIIRHLCLPTPYFRRWRILSKKPDPKTGNLHNLYYRAHPWYVKPTISARWKLRSWVIWLIGGVLPGDEGSRYHPEGYHIPSVGPEGLQGKGEEEMESTRRALAARRQHE
ncbi:hypothetical protein FQN54_004770 [Arachnomyces sp. PD_36]|nr:hypothetical protein FQN54_004770 [Arachnomyces sp. PD_36]